MAAAGGNPYKVILVGEVHEDPLGEAFDELFSEFLTRGNQTKYGYKSVDDFVFYYETTDTDKQVEFTFQSRPVTRTLLPLEEVEGVLSRGNVFDSVMQESLPARMTSIFYLLSSLSHLMEYYSNPVAFGAAAISSSESPVRSLLSDIEYRLPEVIINCKNPKFRARMTTIFPDQQSVRHCIESPDAVSSTPNQCMENFIDLYEIVHEYFESFKTAHAEYAHIRIPTRPLRLMGMRGVRDITQIIQNVGFAQMSEGLLKEWQSQRDRLMVAKLQSSIAEGGNPHQISVVVVGNDHFVNMKRLLSTSPFELIFTKSTRKKPQIRAMVKIQYFRPDLDGRFGIVTGDSDPDGRTPVLLYGDVDPLILERDNFEVMSETSTDETLRNMFPGQAFQHLISLLTPIAAPLKPGGALVMIKDLKSRPELNGTHGIVTGPVADNGRTPVFCGDVGVDPLGLLSKNFDVVKPNPTDAELGAFFTLEQIAYAKSLNGGSKRYKKSSKRYKKSSKRRCYARTRKGKRSKRRSAKKY